MRWGREDAVGVLEGEDAVGVNELMMMLERMEGISATFEVVGEG
jgi:hypothetical protein